jgi:hypothetical protein
LGQNRSHGWFLPHPLLAFRPAAKPNAGGLPDFGLWPQPDALAVPELTCTAHIKLNTQVSLWPTHAAIRLPGHIEQVRLSIMPSMRIVAIAVVLLLSPAVAHASKDCMTKAEARNVYRTSYLYWHGKGRC